MTNDSAIILKEYIEALCYSKDITWTQTEILEAIANAIRETNLVIIVTNLPETDIQINKLYLVPSTNPRTTNLFDIFFYANGGWEQVDGLNFNIEDYYTKDEIDTILEDKANRNHNHTDATTSASGFMSSSDKTKLNGISAGANKTVVDNNLSTISTNPVQNKIVNEALDTKVNSVDLDDVAFSGDYNDLSNTPHIPDKVSELENDSGYLTTHQSLANYYNKTEVDSSLNTKVDKVTGKQLSSNDYTTAEKNKVATIDDKVNIVDLDDVAFSGDYNDLSNTPHIPDKVSELTNDSGYLTKHQSLDSKTITIEKQSTPESGYSATYVVKQGGTAISPKINIPKDFLVKSGTVKTVTTANIPVNGYNVGEKYLDFVINTKDNSDSDEHLYINVKDLVDNYTADEVTLTLANKQFKIKDGGVSFTKLDNSLQSTINNKSDNGHTHSKSEITDFPSTMTPSSHSHGSLSNNGTLNSDITSMNKIAVTDSSNNLKTISKLPADKVTHQDISNKIDTAGTGLSKSGTTLNHSNSVTAQTTSALKKIKYDAQGHITGTDNVAKSDITGLGIPAQDTTYTHPSTHASTMITESSALSNIGTNANSTQHAVNEAINTKIDTLATKESIDDIVAGDVDLTGYVKDTDSRLTDSRTPKSHTHGNISNDGAISGQASKNVVTDANGKITTEAKPTIPSANATASNIKMNGTQSAGSLATFAKADHVHPVDTSRAASSHTHTKSQISDFPTSMTPTSHSHGSLANGGTLNSDITSVNKVAVTDSSNNLKTINKVPFENLDISKSDITGLGIPGSDTNTTYTADNSSLQVSSNQFSIKTGGVTSSHIADKTIVNGDIADTTIQGGKLVNGTVAATQLASNSVETAKIKDANVTNTKLADFPNNVTEYIVGTQTANTSAWTGKSTKITSLQTGQVIYYRLPYASTSTAVTLALTLADSSATVVTKNVRYNYGTNLTTHFPVNTVLCLVYDGTYWICTAIQNTNNYDRISSYGQVVNGETSQINAYTLICGKSDKKYYRIASGVVFDIRYPIVWLAGNLASGGNTNNVYGVYAAVNLQNTISGKTITNLQETYIEGTAFSNGQFTISSNVFVSDGSLTSGRYYIPIGQAYSTTNIRFVTSDKVFYYNGTSLIPVSSWNGVTDKPSTYTPSSHTHGNVTNDGKIGSTANLPVITGTNGALTTGSFGTSANTFCQGNDSRLSNARTPTAHTDSNGAYGKATTSVWGHTKLSSATNSTDETMSATPKAVKSAYDLANGKSTVSFTQAKTSGVEIGTITIDGTDTKLYQQDNNTTYSVATQSANGLLSSTDKKKLDGIATSANNYSHPSTHASTMITESNALANIGTSANATQSAINSAINNKFGTVIPNGTSSAHNDLNKYVSPGFYYQSANANTTYIDNLPNNTRLAFTLLVEHHTGTYGVKQTLTFYNTSDPQTFIRIGAYNATATTGWGAWKEVAWTSDIPSLSNYVQKSSTEGLLKNDGTVMTSGTGASNFATGNHTHSYVATSQGTGNSGKFLKVNSSGNVACESVTIPSAYTHPNSGVTAGTNYNGNQTPSFGGTFNIPKLTFNAQGHITASANSTVKIPSLPAASTSQAGIIQIGTGASNAAAGNHSHNNYLNSFSTHTWQVGSSYVKIKYNDDIVIVQFEVGVSANVIQQTKTKYSANQSFAGSDIFGNIPNVPKPPFDIWTRNYGEANIYGGMSTDGSIICLCEDASFTSAFSLKGVIWYPIF